MLPQQVIKFCFPKKIDIGQQSGQGLYPVVIVFKMIGMEKFDVLQRIDLEYKDKAARFTGKFL